MKEKLCNNPSLTRRRALYRLGPLTWYNVACIQGDEAVAITSLMFVYETECVHEFM